MRQTFRRETQALLFDLDGTLIDSDPDHLAAFQEVLAPYGIALDRALYAAHVMGASNALIGERLLAHLPAGEREAVFEAKEAAYRQRMGAAAAPTRGAAELLAYAGTLGLPCAVVTNAPRANAEKALAAIGLVELFPILVIGAELARSKPDPLPYLTALQNLQLPLQQLHLPADRGVKLAQEYLDRCGIGALQGRYPRELSGGELQRIAIARALVHRPRLLLADEPTGNLDARAAALVLQLLREQLRETGAGAILITHSATAAACADRTLRLTGGRLTARPQMSAAQGL